MKRKRFKVHNYSKNCGNCGLNLYEDDDIMKVEGNVGILDSAYFHSTYKGCENATEQLSLKLRTGNRNHAVNYG